VGKGDIKINREISGPEYEKFLGPSTLAHEMTHATDRQLQEQDREQSGMFSKGNQFTDAYQKMVGSGGMREGKKRTELARKYYPEFVSGNRDYRATPYEIVAHGVGKYAGPTTADDAPPHVDATAATEFQILLDLARRNSDSAVKKRAKGSPEEGEVSQAEYAKGGTVEDIGKWLKDNDMSPADLLAMFGRAGGASSVALAPSSTNDGEAEQLKRRRAMPPTIDRAKGGPVTKPKKINRVSS
jgi:hypothetical protein